MTHTSHFSDLAMSEEEALLLALATLSSEGGSVAACGALSAAAGSSGASASFEWASNLKEKKNV